MSEPWVSDDEAVERAAIRRELGFGWDHPNLPPDQLLMLRSMEAAERAEERERQERIADRAQRAEDWAFAEAAHRAHLAGEHWDPSQPLKHYPTRAQRAEMAFAAMDLQLAVDVRAAKQAAARVLRDHGVTGQVIVDASQTVSPSPSAPRSNPAGVSSPAGTATRSRGSRIRAILRHMAEVPRDPHPLAHDAKDRFWHEEYDR
jgi:hypothetical protein